MSAEPTPHMSADSAESAPPILDDVLTQTLISRCRLAPEAIDKILDSMRELGSSFVDAALGLDLVTPGDVAQAKAAIRASAAREKPGLIEAIVESARSVVVVPQIRAKASDRVIIAHHPDHPRSERIRALRTELLLRNEPGSLRANMLVLLSPGKQEGRSQLAAELAVAFSQLGQRTLLVDADLRRPRQHELFCAENIVGLAQALAVGGDPRVIGVEGLPNLVLLPAGSTPTNPSELLAGDRAERLAVSWRNNYQYVVIDTPPIEEFSDGLMMAALIGRVLTLSRAQISTHRGMQDMLRRLVSTQARVLGSVINKF